MNHKIFPEQMKKKLLTPGHISSTNQRWFQKYVLILVVSSVTISPQIVMVIDFTVLKLFNPFITS